METFIFQTCQEIIPGRAVIFSPIFHCFTIVNKIHRLWRWHYRTSQVWADANNFKKLLAGHVVRWTVGDRLLIRIAAQTVLIARRFVDCAQQQHSFHRITHLWVKTITGKTFIRPNRNSLVPHCSYLSPSTVYWCQWTLASISLRVKQVIERSWQLLKEAFILSMCYLDIIEAFSLSDATRNESVNELFLNSSKLMDDLIKNNDQLLEELENHKIIIKKVLKKLNSGYHYEHLFNAIASTLEKTEKVYRTIKKIPKGVESTIKDSIHSFLFALTGWAPQFLLPIRDQKTM